MNLLPKWLRDITLPIGTSNIIVLSVTVLLISTLLSTVIGELVSPTSYRQGEVADYTIRAPRDILIENTLETEQRRAEAAAAVNRVFSLNDKLIEEVTTQLDTIFAALRKIGGESSGEEGRIQLSRSQRESFEVQFNFDFVGDEWDVLAGSSEWVSLADSVREMVEPIMRKGVIANEVPLRKALAIGPAVLRQSVENIDREISSVDEVYSLSEAKETIQSSLSGSAIHQTKAHISVLRKFSLALLQANITFDARETENRIVQARDGVKPSYQRIKRGEVIVRQGDIITKTQERRLEQIRQEVGTQSALRNWFGYFFLTALVLLVVFGFAYYFWPGVRRSPRDMSLVAITLVGSLVMIKATSFIAASLGEAVSYFDSETFILATPVAAGGILLQVTVGASGVFMFMLSFALLTGLFLKNSWLILLLIIVGNIVGSIAMRQCSRRSAFIAAGARVALANMFIMLCFLLLFSDYSAAENASRILWALVGGLASGILGGGFAPIAEYLGGYITDIKLLELASLDRPLLRELSVQAPGTWNHSMVIGQMGEAAADAIGANGLLVRVGAYYHDIGKMKKPAYFVENQTGENRHDKLTPSMSALIIKAHVKDGLEMAIEHRLPNQIVEFIPQHHGSSLISYFYTKALKDAEADEIVEESHYRYPGPKPQSKEAGILMVADAVEASSRTVQDPTPAKLQGLVQKIINRIFASGELEECDLTLRDLHAIAKTFTRVLTGIYHRRVEYSEPAEKVKDPKQGGNSSKTLPALNPSGATPSKKGASENADTVKVKQDSTSKDTKAATSKDTVSKDKTSKDKTAKDKASKVRTSKDKAPTEKAAKGKTSATKEKDNANRDSEQGGAEHKAQGDDAQSADGEDSKDTLKRLGM